MGDALVLRGELTGHRNWVTAIATTDTNPNMIVSASRDKTVMVWQLGSDGETPGQAVRSLHGHSHFVSDVTLSNDGAYALSSSWDGTLRLWDIATGECQKTFSGHSKDALSVAFSPDNRQIVSGSRDKSIKLWNTIGECKFTIENAHADWVSCVRFSPNAENPVVVSAGWDKTVRVTSITNLKQRVDLVGHRGYINTITVSPDGSLCASGGKDGVAMLWDLNASWDNLNNPDNKGKHLYSLDTGSVIHSLCFSPNRYWLCAATSKNITIWDLESKAVVAELSPEWEERSRKALTPYCTSLAWSADGSTLFSGYTDNKIRVWAVSSLAS